MAMTADSSQSHQSPRSVDAVTVNSPQKRKNLPSAWAQVVRGEPESIPAVHQVTSPPPSTSPTQGSAPEQSTFSDCSPLKAASSPPPTVEISVAAIDSSEGNNDNAGRLKKPAWKKPSNGVAEVSPVMGAVSWPALSESTKFSPKSPAADSSPKIVVSDGSMPSPQAPVLPHSPHKQASGNAKSNSTSNHAMPTRQRSMKRGSGGGGSGGGHSQSSISHPPPPPPPPPPFPLFPMPPNGYGNMVPLPDQSPREPSYRGNNWEPRPVGGFVPQPPAVNDSRHSSRRGNFGPRGDGPYHNNFGGRRDQDRGHYGNARDVPVQSQRSPRGFVRAPPPNTAAFVPPQPVRPFANPMGYPDLIYIPTLPLEFSGMSYITPAPRAMIVPAPEPPLPAKLLHQIEYYFSDANLIKDEFLKSNMDDQGWVPITLIAGFNRVKSMTNDIQFILDSLRSSTFLEVQDDKVRRHSDWLKWISGSTRLPADSGSQTSSATSHDMLTSSFQKMTVEEVTADQNSVMVKSSPNSEDAPASSSQGTAHLQSSQGEGIEDASLS